MDDDNIPQLQEYFLRPGYIYLPRVPTRISTVLGSCVAVCVWDRVRSYGGMNHYLYPLTNDPEKATALYGNVATRALVRFFLEAGSRPQDLEAQIFGGGFIPDLHAETQKIGEENVDMARRVLKKCRVRVVSEDVGGSKGRKLVYNSLSNEMLTIRVETLREGDWYPYEGRR